MNERELRQAIAAKQAEFKEKRDAGASVSELQPIADETAELRKQLDLVVTMRENELSELHEPIKTKVDSESRAFDEMTEEELETEYSGAFLRAIRNSQNVSTRDEELLVYMRATQDTPTATPYLKSNTEADGGLLIPKDIQTMIHEYKRTQEFELQQLISVEQTRFTSGSRVFEKLAAITPFENINEWDKIEDIPAPQFEKKEYTMADYAGILPLPRRMLQDTDTNLKAHIAKFIARKTVITRNMAIKAALETLTKNVAVKTVDAIKDILNVSLDPVFAGSAVIVTNQDGYNWLDKCKDEKGNYLMQKDVTSATGYSFLGKTVVVIPNRTLPSTSKKAPVYIGDLKEAVVMFDRGVYEITSTEVGGQAFRRNSLDIRVIDRFSVMTWDTEAVYRTEIDTAKAPELPSTSGKVAGA